MSSSTVVTVGHHLVPARLGQQRAVVAQRLVAVGARQVEDLGHRAPRRARLHDVVAWRSWRDSPRPRPAGRSGGRPRSSSRSWAGLRQAVAHALVVDRLRQSLGRGEVAIAGLPATMQARRERRRVGRRRSLSRHVTRRVARRLVANGPCSPPAGGKAPHDRDNRHRANMCLKMNKNSLRRRAESITHSANRCPVASQAIVCFVRIDHMHYCHEKVARSG